jgi:purine-cytosine permease-like protein
MSNAASTELPSPSTTDAIGHIEAYGVERIPESARHGRPMGVAWVFFGAQMTYGSLLMGALGPSLGLGWWSTVVAIIVGTLLGSLGVAAMAIIGPRTGTTSTVASGAFFGVRGRFVGVTIAMIIDLGYFAMILWVSAPPLLHAAHILLDVPESRFWTIAVLCGVAVVVLALGILGHATLVAYEKFTAVANVACMGVLVVSSIGSFHLAPVSSSETHLGFWPAWFLTTTGLIANAVSYSTFAGDFTRYLPSDTRSGEVFSWTLAGMVAGCFFALGCGAFLALTVDKPSETAAAMLDHVSIILLLPVVLIGFIGNASNGGMVAYNGTLNLHALLWKLRRVDAAILFSVIGILVGYIGLVAFDLMDSIVSLCSIVTVLVTPWILINIIGVHENGGVFDAASLQEFSGGADARRYWFRNGFRPGAIVAWAIGAAVGLLFADTSIFVGPLAHFAGGIDLSFLGSGVTGALIYLAVYPPRRADTARVGA